jgi:hypothetical protein
VTIQLLFIADLKHKRIDEEKPDDKPGRQAVTFLMICNLGLWITYNFEIQKVNVTKLISSQKFEEFTKNIEKNL